MKIWPDTKIWPDIWPDMSAQIGTVIWPDTPRYISRRDIPGCPPKLTRSCNRVRRDEKTEKRVRPNSTRQRMITTQRTSQEPTEPAVRCPTCHTPTFWRSAYGGELRCAVCDPWPSLAMVGERWTIRTRTDRSLEWVPCLRRGERAVDRCEVAAAPDTANGIRWQEVEDEDGTWLVVWRVRT